MSDKQEAQEAQEAPGGPGKPREAQEAQGAPRSATQLQIHLDDDRLHTWWGVGWKQETWRSLA